MSLGGSTKQVSESRSKTKQRVVLPDYLQGPIEDLVGRIEETSLRPYTPYTGERVAGFTPDTLSAFQGVRGLQGQQQPLLDAASELSLRASQGVTPEDITRFMNPYQQQVTDIGKREALSDFDILMNQIQDQQMQTGAFGGSRTGVAEGIAREDIAERLSDLQITGSQQAYDRALGTSLANVGLQQAGVGNLLGAAAGRQDIGLRDVAALQQIGGQQQALGQAGLDVAYGDFLQEQQRPYENVQFATANLLPLTDLLRGQNVRGTATTTGTQSAKTSPLSTILGIASVAGSFIPGTGGATVPGAPGQKAGGLVKYAKGGAVRGWEDTPGYQGGGRVFQPASTLGGLEDLLKILPQYTPSPEDTRIERLMGGLRNLSAKGGTAPIGALRGLGELMQKGETFATTVPSQLEGTPVSFADPGRAYREADLQGARFRELGIGVRDTDPVRMLLESFTPTEETPEDKTIGATKEILDAVIKNEGGTPVFSVPDKKEEKYKFGIQNMALFRAGAAMLSGTGTNFGQDLGRAANAYADVKQGISSSKVEGKQQEFENMIKLMSSRQQGRRIDLEERRAMLQEQSTPLKQAKLQAEVNKLNREALTDPYLKKAIEIDAQESQGIPESSREGTFEERVRSKAGILRRLDTAQGGTTGEPSQRLTYDPNSGQFISQ